MLSRFSFFLGGPGPESPLRGGPGGLLPPRVGAFSSVYGINHPRDEVRPWVLQGTPIAKNIKKLNCENKCQILKSDCFYLSRNFDQKVDIIFMDPPYKENNLFSLIKCIIESEILTKDGIIVIHRHKKKKDKFPKKFNILEEKKYGISKIIFGNFF